MNERLELYREILEIEPNSRVFFPYAKLLEQESFIEDALAVLARGLEKQPDYLEARLYYIDLLARMDKLESAKIQLQKFTDIFKNYSGFWLTWSKLTADENATISSTLALLSTLFSNPSLSLLQVFQAGIQAHVPQESSNDLQKVWQNAPLLEPVVEEEPVVDVNSIASCDELAEPVVVEIEEDILNMEPESVEDTSCDVDTIVEDTLETLPIHEAEEVGKTSTNTRSMADLLAEQGDIQGAIDIYTDLILHEEGSEKEVLLTRLQSLEAHLAGQPVSEKVDKAVTTETKAKKISPRMQTMLEKLAGRLEQRATV